MIFLSLILYMQFLIHLDYEVVQAFDALEAEDALYESHFDLMLLDIKVPYKNNEVQLLKLFLANPNRTIHKPEVFEAQFDVRDRLYIPNTFITR